MKPFLALLYLLTLTALPLRAQTNAPVRLALISENDPAGSAVDVLTTQFSHDPRVQLLERDQIARVYQELNLSAANADYLKLGQMLGADGLLLVQSTREGTAPGLNVRLVAVQPGVVLRAEQVSWPVPNPAQWAAAQVAHLAPYLPKLKVLSKDAIPLSVVNLRSAVSSAEARGTERQLKLLAIQRLSQEPPLFVLERQKMALLGEEKLLKADDSAFWNGSWLLEGVVDQNGYSPDTITIDAMLTPPKGAAPVQFTVSGSRTNLTEVINQLALQVTAALKINPTVKEWQTAAEAQQYFAEAQWALRWGAYAEAQSAADAAWALGRHDMDCARLRVQTYMVSPDAGKSVIVYPPDEAPDPQTITDATHALEVYTEVGRNLPPDEPTVDSDWYRLGLEILTQASRELQVYNWSPDFYTPVADKLADLRAAARATAEWLSRSPSVHDSYFTGDREVGYDDLINIAKQPSIFSVTLDCGSLWQDRPEDMLANYRTLLASPVFGYIHNRFWFRDSYQAGALHVLPPRLVAWNAADQQRISGIWTGFLGELNTSTNVLWQLEGIALKLADLTDGEAMGPVFTNLMTTVLAHRAELVACPVELFPFVTDWHLGDLVEHSGAFTHSEQMEALQQIYKTVYMPQIDAMDREYRGNRDKKAADLQAEAAFAAQKQYLTSNRSPNFFEFIDQFHFRGYTRSQALEIQPLIAAYKSNLVALAQSGSFKVQQDAEAVTSQVNFLEMDINAILNPPPSHPWVHQIISRPPGIAGGMRAAVPPASHLADTTPEQPRVETNVIAATQFYALPVDNLVPLADGESRDPDLSRVTVHAHHWQEGRLLLDFHYDIVIDGLGNNQHLTQLRNQAGDGIALLDPATGHWEVLAAPEAGLTTQNRFYNRTTLLGGEVYTCEAGQIQHYDRASQQWQVLPVSDGVNYELFAVAGKLYAASKNQIFEIAADGKSTRLLASNRRQPPASPLDTEDLGTPLLFAGPNHSLRVSTKNNIYAWTGNDWQTVCAAPPAGLAREFDNAGVLFFADGWKLSGGISRLLLTSNRVEYCLESSDGPGRMAGAAAPTQFEWKLPTPTMILGNLPAALRQNDLYLLVDHAASQDAKAEAQPNSTGKRISAQNGYEAELLCYTYYLPAAAPVYLRFDNAEGCPPVTGHNPATVAMPPALPPGWLEFTPGGLLCGLENPDRWMPGAADKVDSHYKAGVWVLPLAPIDRAVAAQRQAQQSQVAGVAEAAKKQQLTTAQFQKDFLNKYDHNHNGVLDPEERAEAKDDPDYSRYMINILRARQNSP